MLGSEYKGRIEKITERKYYSKRKKESLLKKVQIKVIQKRKEGGYSLKKKEEFIEKTEVFAQKEKISYSKKGMK